jgi:predicted phage gp36 major capsid-like protein
MATRMFNQPSPTIKTPQKLDEWRQMMRRTIEKAEKANDRRQHGLRKALADDNSEKHLRMLGIISEADILREFPEKG